VSPSHAHSSKAEAIRTLRDGFGICNASDINLVLHRKPHPDHEVLRHNSAGALPAARRNPDIPAIVRSTSLEHITHRRRSAPPMKRQESSENLIIRLLRIAEDSARIGRNVRVESSSRSPTPSQERSLVSPRLQRRSPQARSRSPSMKAIMSGLLPLLRTQSVSELSTQNSCGNSCSWGESLAFDLSSPCASGNVTPQSTSFGSVHVDQAEGATASQTIEAVVGVPQMLKKRAASEACLSEVSTAFRSCSTNTQTTRCSTPRETSILQRYGARNKEKFYATIYERRIENMVKAAQKRASKKANA